MGYMVLILQLPLTLRGTGVQQPGDIIYVPEGYSHAVLNLEESLAVAAEIKLVKSEAPSGQS